MEKTFIWSAVFAAGQALTCVTCFVWPYSVRLWLIFVARIAIVVAPLEPVQVRNVRVHHSSDGHADHGQNDELCWRVSSDARDALGGYKFRLLAIALGGSSYIKARVRQDTS